jgi:signal transduction histidine kinase
LLPAFALMVATASESRSRAEEQAQQNALGLTELAAANQRQLIDGARDILVTLAQLPAIQSSDRPACLFFLSNVLMQHPLYANFGAADSQGDVFCMTLPQRLPVNISQEVYFRQAVEGRDFAISEYQISPTNAQAVVTLAYPILGSDGLAQGIVFANLDLRWLNQFAAAAALPQGSTLRVIDRSGMTLVAYPDGDAEVGQAMPERQIAELVLAQRQGLTQRRDVSGRGRLYAFTPLQAAPDSDVYMIISIPTDVAFADSDRDLRRNLAGLAIGALLALAVAWFGTDIFFLRQVQSLVAVTHRLTAGDLSARAGRRSGAGELDQLATAFDEMAEALQQREQERFWAEKEIRLQTARWEALARIAGRLNAKLDLHSVLHAVCEETCQALRLPAAGVALYENDGHDIYTLGGSVLNEIGQIKLEAPPRGFVLDHAESFGNQPALVDLDCHPGLRPVGLSPRSDMRFLTMANLEHEGELIGRLEAFAPDDASIGEEGQSLLKSIANEAALAITNARLYTALRTEERARAGLLHQVIGAQEDERMRISRELHDETSQSLTALLVGLDTIRIASQDDPERIGQYLQNLKAITEDLLVNIHRLIADLRPSLLDDLGLLPAIAWYGEERLKPKGIEFRLEDRTQGERLSRPIETALFRIVQEGLTNIVRHARASEVGLRLDRHAEGISLEIEDNGKGFDPRTLDAPDSDARGVGLRGMRERAAILGGTLELHSSPGEGTCIRICFPVYAEQVIHG